ncbi:hypothetical protein J1N35_007583 [Gossypium stocksii]|uniref:Uncharacterized protein n=1 Tax=Gossypium stocksii TaxID=47602 RepID=A0A9D3W9G8_9ROSI|nr:hypothetical protein J1N35_007583 [Gossypium stocksii]
MDSEVKQSHEELSVSLEHESVRDMEVKVSLLTSGNDNPELGTKALTRLVREVLEEVIEARVRANGETLQARCLECSKKREPDYNHSVLDDSLILILLGTLDEYYFPATFTFDFESVAIFWHSIEISFSSN